MRTWTTWPTVTENYSTLKNQAIFLNHLSTGVKAQNCPNVETKKTFWSKFFFWRKKVLRTAAASSTVKKWKLKILNFWVKNFFGKKNEKKMKKITEVQATCQIQVTWKEIFKYLARVWSSGQVAVLADQLSGLSLFMAKFCRSGELAWANQ